MMSPQGQNDGAGGGGGGSGGGAREWGGVDTDSVALYQCNTTSEDDT